MGHARYLIAVCHYIFALFTHGRCTDDVAAAECDSLSIV